jgi:uncharacterized iron-regulated membrane protein
MPANAVVLERLLRSIHRAIMVLAVLFLLSVGVTGVWMQGIDIKTILAHAPASDPTMQSIRDGISGPPNFFVISLPDYTAADLPASLDVRGAMAEVLRAARREVGGAALDFIELRVSDHGPVGLVQSLNQLRTFDVRSGQLLKTDVAQPIEIPMRPGSLRDKIKSWHRMVVFGSGAAWIELATTLALAFMVVSGLWIYIRLLMAERQKGRKNWFWARGDRWRTLHRSVGWVACLFLLAIATSGLLLATDSIAGQSYLASLGMKIPGLNGANPLMTSAASPLIDDALPDMLGVTMAAAARVRGDDPVRVIRLRYYAGMPQGVVITGGAESRQLVFNAATGARASSYEKGYPKTPFPFGWHFHELVKRIHRGDFFGMTGRWTDLFAGLSLVFLATSGLVMYSKMLNQRRRSGRDGLFWR